jgi:hypothetical protein
MKWLLIAIVFCVVLFVVVHRFSATSLPTFSTTDEKMQWLAEEAKDIAKNQGVTLDYSSSSIREVEEVLSKLHEQYQSRNDDSGMHGLAMAFGAYIGETIRREYEGAYWQEDHKVAGPGSFPIHWQGSDSFPVGWCYKRIKNGPEDNVWHKYQFLREQKESEKTQESE